MSQKKNTWKPFLFLLLMAAVIVFYFNGGEETLSFKALRNHLLFLQEQYHHNPVLVITFFFLGYVLLTALSIPGSLVLTLMAGAIFGTPLGLVLVSLSGTLGALIAFLIARYLLKEYVSQKFSRQFDAINSNLKLDGVSYLFTLRMIPVSPFVMINLVMGLTTINWYTFVWTTLLGMIPGNFLYVYAGRKIGEIESPAEIMTWPLIIALSLLGILPWTLRRLMKMRKHKWKPRPSISLR
jgi:uncharacterized membrane protein YdjX (TVP38/TMEM64 family)